jgi:hypothetical protein
MHQDQAREVAFASSVNATTQADREHQDTASRVILRV